MTIFLAGGHGRQDVRHLQRTLLQGKDEDKDEDYDEDKDKDKDKDKDMHSEVSGLDFEE